MFHVIHCKRQPISKHEKEETKPNIIEKQDPSNKRIVEQFDQQ